MSDGIVLPTHSNFKNLTDKVVGRLTVISYLGYVGRYRYWECRCECGVVKKVQAMLLAQNKVISCGCQSREAAGQRARTHGKRHTRLYNIWNGMRARCHRPDNPNYRRYGARGISVCEEWRGSQSFQVFYEWAMANGYRDDLSIDRYPDRDGNYEPSNCRWATVTEQARNKDVTTYIEAFGASKTAAEWAEDSRAAVIETTILSRVNAGWMPEKAITTPSKIPCSDRSPVTAFGETKSLADWSRDCRCVVTYRALVKRVRRGIHPELAITTPPSGGHLYERVTGTGRRLEAIDQARKIGIKANYEYQK